MLLYAGLCLAMPADSAERENDYYKLVSILTPQAPTDSRAKHWKPAPDDLPLEVSGIAVLDDRRIAVTIRKGEVWILDRVFEDPPARVTYHRFATGLHEPLGLAWDGHALYTAQRSELTRLGDTDADGRADEYTTVAAGWGLTGHYHEYAYGPKRDRAGNWWLTLNIGLGLDDSQQRFTLFEPMLQVRQARWRGWGMRVTPEGELQPVCAGMRSPSGLGMNQLGDMFYTDQQGNWVPTNALHHMRSGVFFHHPESLASMHEAGSTLSDIDHIPAGLPYPEAVRRLPALKPPAVWFPYKKMGQSSTDIVLDESNGRFGPFAGQLFVGEFTQAAVHRVFLEQVDGQYQGACFPFRSGFASAVLRLAQGHDGSLLAGLTNRGWSSLGRASYGLERLVWTGKIPFEIKEMRARSDGFELVFTCPVDVASACDPASYQLNSYTYLYHPAYGSDEIMQQPLVVATAEVAADGRSVYLKVEGLRELFVHELVAPGVRCADGRPLLHSQAYYTLNRIPKADPQ